MLTFSNLTKTLTSGSLALGVAAVASVSSALFVAPSAQAAFLGTVDELLDAGEVVVGDKKFYDFSFYNITEGFVFIDFFSDDEAGVFSYAPDLFDGGGLTEGIYAISYSVDILFPPALPNTTFDFVGLAVGEDSTNFTVTKEVIPNFGDAVTLFADDFSPVDTFSILGATSVNVTDTIAVGPDGLLTNVFNGYFQTTPVPEPEAILGLLAIGGLGLVSRFTKQR